MTRFRHLAIVALVLMTCTVRAFAHIPRDVLNPTLASSPLRVHSPACAGVTADRCSFVVLFLDAHGNITAMDIEAGLLPVVTPKVMRLKQNAADELTSVQTKANPGVQGCNTATPAHDEEGNLTSDGTLTFGYDYENRLLSVSSASLQETFFYAGDGTRMVSQVIQGGSTNITIFVLDYADPLRRPLAELDENGALVRRFVWGRGVVAQIEANGTVHYFHHDGQGSTLALTDSGAATTDQWFYSPYGEVMTRTGTTATPYQWCGGVGVRGVSVGGLYFARHRYYHAGLRRFLSPDPIGVQGLLAWGGMANLYQYGNNSPLVHVDPDGLWTIQIGGSGAGGLAAGGTAGGGIVFGYSEEHGFEFGTYKFAGGAPGTYVGKGGSLTVDISWSANPHIEDVGGGTLTKGGSGTLGAGLSIGGEANIPLSGDLNVSGHSKYTSEGHFKMHHLRSDRKGLEYLRKGGKSSHGERNQDGAESSNIRFMAAEMVGAAHSVHTGAEPAYGLTVYS